MAKLLADLLGGHVDLHSTGDARPRLAPLDDREAEAELCEHRRRVHALRDRWRQDPSRALRDLRAFFHEPELSAQDARAWLDTWLFAVDEPHAFERALGEEEPQALGLSARSWFRDLRAYLHAPPALSREARAVVDHLLALHGWPDVETLKRDHQITLNPNIRQFEKLDPWWLTVAEASLVTKLGRWPNLEKFVSHTDATPFVYQASPAEAARPIGLFADFGTGSYHSRLIAKQLERRAVSYAFHLGDVYYGGREHEFARYYEEPLRGVVAQSKLFSLAENHELFSGGKWYLDFLRDPAKRGISPQQGSYFCVRFPHHQIIGIDVNWHKRARFLHGPSRKWLQDQLANAEGRTTILLSGCGPYPYGSDTSYTLLSDLWNFLRDGQIAMWLWGDDHYCALYDRDDLVAPFYGSCIGHGGFPGLTQQAGRPSWAPSLWVEDEPRFPRWTGLRGDVMNNGWCELQLDERGGFALTYVDWLGAQRCRVAFTHDAGRLRLKTLTTFPRPGAPPR